MHWISESAWQQFGADGTDAHRIATSDEGWLDRYGDWLLWSGPWRSGAERSLGEETRLRFGFEPKGWLVRGLAKTADEQSAPVLVKGEKPGAYVVREATLAYEAEPAGGYSTGLFLDQRLNRAWVRELGVRRMLNLFAYTCSFSVSAAVGGADTCNVDVGKRALVRGRENFALNGIDLSSGHRFVAEDAIKYVSRLAKRGERFDLIIVDPPTFGRADGRAFRLERDFPGLLQDCFELLEPDGWILASCNYARWGDRAFRDVCSSALRGHPHNLLPGHLPPEIPRGSTTFRIHRES